MWNKAYVGYEDISTGKSVIYYAQYRKPGFTTNKAEAHLYTAAHAANLSQRIYEQLRSKFMRPLWIEVNCATKKEWAYSLPWDFTK